MKPYITVLLPLKNHHPAYLQQGIASITAQTDGAWRLIVIVEPQDYDYFAAALRRQLTDRRMQLTVNQGRKLAGAINAGMRDASTDFVALLLADDMWDVDAARVLNAYIDANPDVDFFHSSRQIIDGEGKPISSIHSSRALLSVDDFKVASPIKHLLCWRRAKALAIGGLDETLNSVAPDDYDFPWSMAENGARFKAVAECLYYYRDHRDAYRLTTHLPLSVHTRETERIFKKHGVGWRERRRYIARARQTYLRQCLYKNTLDRWVKQWLGYDAHRGWRETYS